MGDRSGRPCSFFLQQARSHHLQLRANSLRSPFAVRNAPTTLPFDEIDTDDVRAKRSVLAIVLILLAVAPYLQTFRHAFVSFDDGLYVTTNPVVLQGLTTHGLVWSFSTFEGGNWHPLTWISHMLDVSLWGGVDGWPGGHHLTNVILHAANTLVLFLALLAMTSAAGIWRSALVSALFAVHPLHVESVAWIAERKDLLSTFFGLMAVLSYARYARAPSWRRMTAVFVLMAASLLAKPMLVTLPFVLLLFDFWPLQRMRTSVAHDLRCLLIEKVPLFLLSAAMCVVAMRSQSSGGNVASIDALPLTARLANAVVSYGTYLHRNFVPTNLAVFYPYQEHARNDVILQSLVVGVISLVAVVLWRSRPWWLVGWLFFLGTLVPVIGLVQIGLQSTADRYMYVPSIGIFLIIAWSIPSAESRWGRRGMLGGSALVVLILAAMAHVQASHWRDSETLFKHASEVTRFNYLAHQNLGAAHERKSDFPAALSQYELAAKYRPTYAKVWVDMANVLLQLGRHVEASERIDVAIQLDDRSSAAHNTKGVLLMVGERFEQAEVAFQRAVELDPGNMQARSNLGAVALRQGHANKAIANLAIVAKEHPERLGVRTNLARALAAAGRKPEAMEELQHVLRTNPDFEPARIALQELSR